MGKDITCVWCGVTVVAHYQTIDEGAVCAECAQDLYYCHYCGTSIHIEESEWADEKPFCQDCYERHFATCDVCGEVHYKEDGSNTQRGFVCHECLGTIPFVRCSVCHELTDEYTVYTDESNNAQIMCIACHEYLHKLMAVCTK